MMTIPGVYIQNGFRTHHGFPMKSLELKMALCLPGILNVLLWSFLFSASTILAQEKPNFVIVLADDVSWSSLGCSDSGIYTQIPNIDQLATQGIRFKNFSCAVAQCSPARHELYTGLLPPTSGVHANGTKAKGDFKSIINYLGDLGYNVGLSGKNHFKNKSQFQIVPGFDSDGNSDAPTWEMSGVKGFIKKSQSEKKPFCMVIERIGLCF
jgi:N-sulfoglucosamine sulfohydrolase